MIEEQQQFINELNKEIIITHTLTAKRLLKLGKVGIDAFTLYNFYCYCASLQLTNKVYATDQFCVKGLHWGRTRFRRAKNLLIKEEIIETVIRHEQGRIRGHYIHIHYLNGFTRGTKNNTVVKQPCGNQTPNAYDNNLNALDNKNKNTSITSSKEEGETPSSYGNQDINYLIDFLKEKTGLTKLDCSIKQNRRYCWLALKKFGGRQKVEAIIKMALHSDFHRKNLTSMKYIYYNGVKIVSEFKEEIENPRFISIGKKI